MTATDELRERWYSGAQTLGLWLAIPSPVSAELASIVGSDYVCIDQQHGLVGYESLVNMLLAVGRNGPIPITRVAKNDSAMIALSLDAGACGVVVPMVSTVEEAEQAVAACRYPPMGIRSYGPIRAARIMGVRDPVKLGGGALCVVMIETLEGLENAEAIAATDGVDALYIGPADLAVSLGLPPALDKTEPEHTAAVTRVLQAARAAGIGAGIQCASGQSARRFLEMGFNMVTVAKDNTLVERAFRQELADARSSQSEEVEVAYS